ncbi:MAG: 23S rRNA (uracil(1939)-C(5))-methyltransferase RlmD [Candidatus Zixiibacteriota bacterium]|nr:MAG: 23S rRNA (uracil(1939)-C(5))-methyltransferase RlmD [candidate division Zixibacteria bacterium]
MKTKDRVGDIFDIEITDLAYNGKAIGLLDGKVVFLNGGLPGEKVRAEITRTKARFSTGRVLNIIDKSAERIKAPCIHYDICGGCTWQDLDYSKQLYYKRKQVVDCLEHIGKFEDVRVAETIGSGERFYYRNKMEFSFNTAEDGRFNLGLHQRGHYDEIFDVDKCLLESELSNDIVAWFRDFVRENRIPVYDVEKHTGFMRFLAIRQSKNTDQVMVNIVTTDGPIPNADKLIETARDRFPQIKTIVQNTNNQKSNIARGEKETILFGEGYIEEKLLRYTFRIYANSFFQTNTRQTETLYRAAFDLLRPDSADHLLDLYCGAGTIGICISDCVAGVTGIELEPSAIQAARENADINNVENIDFHAGNMRSVLKEKRGILEDFTCAIIDPPRAGMHPKALSRLIELDLPRIVYISCNPATFSRDAAELVASGYEISQVVPVDMFPHTMHIELAAGFYK